MRRALFLIAVAISMLQTDVMAQSANANATVVIPEGLFLARNRDLDFGTTPSPYSNGSITVAPAGAATGGQGVVTVSGGQSAQFTASSTFNANQHFWISLPANGTVQLMRAGAPSLQVRDFTVNSSIAPICVTTSNVAPPNSARGSCPSTKAGQTFVFEVGATLDIPSGQPSGVYNGTFDVTITRF